MDLWENNWNIRQKNLMKTMRRENRKLCKDKTFSLKSMGHNKRSSRN